MMKPFALKYGKGLQAFELPADQVLHEIRGRDTAALVDVASAYRHALDHPIDAPPLRELVAPGHRVAIIVSDITRAWQRNDLTLPVLLDYLNRAGVPDDRVTIVIGVGAHRPNTAPEFIELCSQEVCHRVRVVNHNAWDGDMRFLGTTSRGTEVAVNPIVAEADRLILTGGVIYHYMAGFGGGRKSILPGAAALKTIQQNHLLGLTDKIGGGSNPLCASGLTTGNPLHEDMMEVAAFLKPDFLINVVPNLDGELAGIFTGNWTSAWMRACEMVKRIYGVKIEAQADIVIATAGGYPKDINLYQSQKTIDNASYAMKRGGVAIILAQCPLIQDPSEFFDWFKYEDIYAMEKAARDNFLISGWLAIKQLEYKEMGTMFLVTEPENFEHARKAHMAPVASVGEALEQAYRICGRHKATITVMPQGANTFPIIG
jgi:nickel-dependent lactate racemase